jgi:hypothetical protein
MPKSDPGFAQIVGRHFDIDPIAHANSDEVFAHLAGDVGEDLVTVGKGDSKHGARQNLSHRSDNLNWFFFSHGLENFVLVDAITKFENQSPKRPIPAPRKGDKNVPHPGFGARADNPVPLMVHYYSSKNALDKQVEPATVRSAL